jgi:hypothetical protein
MAAESRAPAQPLLRFDDVMDPRLGGPADEALDRVFVRKRTAGSDRCAKIGPNDRVTTSAIVMLQSRPAGS